MAKQVPLTNIRPIVDANGVTTQESREFFNNLGPLSITSGNGSPEGIVDANPMQFYMDAAGTAGAILYIKRDSDIGGDSTRGWILV